VDLEAFARTGVLRCESVFSERDAQRMRDVIWNELRHRHGIERGEPATWNLHPPTGLKSAKRSAAFAPICGPQVEAALDALFGVGRWRRPTAFGNVLVTMPNATAWRVPTAVWHSDFPATLPPDQLRVVKLWALCGDIEAGGGGTPQLSGSHRAFANYLDTTTERDYKRCKFGFLKSHPWLRSLTSDDGDPLRNQRLMSDGAIVHGVDLRVVESVGRAGDVYVTHPWVFHSIAPNASAHPRLMRSVAVYSTIAAM
jgi:Phytanoyl-CoA dioxygenase (PhyH)